MNQHATKRHTLTIYSDGHAWLAVPMALFRSLNIADRISVYSHMSLSCVYLEEDHDMGIFMQAAREAGMEISFKEQTTNGRSRIRSMACYDAFWVDNPPAKGQVVVSHNGEVLVIRRERYDGFVVLGAAVAKNGEALLPRGKALSMLDAEATRQAQATA